MTHDWDANDTADLSHVPVRSAASREQLFPPSRRSRLDYDLLRLLRVNKRAIMGGDALLFFQLILPFGDPGKNTIALSPTTGRPLLDPRMAYYSEVEKFTQSYATSPGLGGSYGHDFNHPQIADLVHFDSIVIRDGVLGGSDGAIHLRWKDGDALFCREIQETMSYTRFLQLKRTYKLNDNNKPQPVGAPRVDPAEKFDLLYKTIVHNTNILSATADLDQCVDETIFGHGGYGPAGSGLMKSLIGKKVIKGGQTVLCADVGRNRVRAYTHRHKCHDVPQGWTREGPREIRRIAECLMPKVRQDDANEEDDDGRDGGFLFRNRQRILFSEWPHITCDNYFGDERIDDWLGASGFGFLHTTRRDCLPSGVPVWAFHKQSVNPKDLRSRVARFNRPITAVKTSPTFTKAHVSFQSTGPTNITCVNSLNKNGLYSKVNLGEWVQTSAVG